MDDQLKHVIRHIGELQAQLIATNAAVHSLIATHPHPDRIAEVFMSHMDGFADRVPADRLEAYRDSYQSILASILTVARAHQQLRNE